MQRPTFFLSSTIFDFRDLRSALKFFLERQGCRVLASEYNDFTKPLDLHSYEACLSTIEQADYFILLLGSRVGGWYDKSSRISITQQEYRRAYELHTQGRLKLLSFVRADVWSFKEDLKSLEMHLKAMDDLNREKAAEVLAFPNKFANDADFIFRFVEEVSRNKETSVAIDGNRMLPTANWLHVFNNFADLFDVIEPLIFGGLAVEDAAARKALQMQLLLLLQDSLFLNDNKVVIPRQYVTKLAQAIDLRVENSFGATTIQRKDLNSLIYVSVLASGAEAKAELFEPFLGSPLLLQYDPSRSSFETTQAYDLLARLIVQIRRFNAAKSSFDFGAIAECARTPGSGSISVLVLPVVHALSMLYRWVEMMDVAKALTQLLGGQRMRVPDPMPRSPFKDQEAALLKEQVALDHVKEYLKLES